MLNNWKPGGAEKRLHNVFVHAGSGTEHACADVGNVRKFEQALDRTVLAEGAVQNGKNDVHVDGTV